MARACIRGAGDLATGVATILHQHGWQVVMSELSRPRVVRRTVSFAEAVYGGSVVVEGLEAMLCCDRDDVEACLRSDRVAVLVDPEGELAFRLGHRLLVDGRMLKRPAVSTLDQAELVIGLGPGFEAGFDCHRVVETMRGARMGEILSSGFAMADTGVPGVIGGESFRRLLRAPADGCFQALSTIGELVEAGQLLARVDGHELRAPIGGRLRGLLHEGLIVRQGEKVGDVDPRGAVVDAHRISDKALACGRAVLRAWQRYEALL